MDNPCDRCSIPNELDVYHGRDRPCPQDPGLPANVIADFFESRQLDCMGIMWKTIGNQAVRALENAGYAIVPNTATKAES